MTSHSIKNLRQEFAVERKILGRGRGFRRLLSIPEQNNQTPAWSPNSTVGIAWHAAGASGRFQPLCGQTTHRFALVQHSPRRAGSVNSLHLRAC